MARFAKQFFLRLIEPYTRTLGRDILRGHVASTSSERARTPRATLLARLHARESIRAGRTACAGCRALLNDFRPERFHGRHVCGDDGDLNLEGGYDDHSSEDVGEVGVDVELVENDQAEHGNQNCNASKCDDRYYLDFASECHVQFPDGVDGKYEDEDVGSDVLVLGQSVEIRCQTAAYQECRNEEGNELTDTLCLWMSGWVEECIQRDALEAGEQPICESEYQIKSHGEIHPAPECDFSREAKVEEEKRHFDNAMSEHVVYLFDK